jgi:hypothetical protein
VRQRRQAVRPPALSAVVGLAITVFGGLVIGLERLGDNSFLTHLATGRLILDGGIPRVDPYSFTAAGEPWVVQSWFASVLYAGAERLGGDTGLVLLRAVLAVALTALIWLLTGPARSLLARVGLAFVALSIGAGLWSERPLLVGLVLLGVLLLAAEGRLHPAWLLPAMWVWVNSHGSFPLGVLAVALFAVGRRLDGERADTELRCLAWAIGGVVAGAVSPLGPKLLLFPLDLLARQDVLRELREWQSPAFDTTAQRAAIVLFAVAIVALVRRPSWRAALPLVVFLAISLVGARNLVVAGLVVLPGTARGLAGVWGSDGAERRSTNWVAAAVLVAFAPVLVATRLPEPVFDLRDYPVAAVTWLEAKGMLEDRVVAPDVVGNYLESRFGADADVFIDDRFDMYPVDVIEDALALHHAEPSWEAVLDRRADVVLWQREAPLGQLLLADRDWRVAYTDDDWLVALPR